MLGEEVLPLSVCTRIPCLPTYLPSFPFYLPSFRPFTLPRTLQTHEFFFLRQFGWQFGAYQNPHLIKLVDNAKFQETDLCKSRFNQRSRPADDSTDNENCRIERAPGFFALVVFDTRVPLLSPRSLTHFLTELSLSLSLSLLSLIHI